MYQKIQKSAFENYPTQLQNSHLAQRSTVQAKQNSAKPVTRSGNEREFEQDRSEVEVSQLQLKEKSGTLTSQEQQKLGVLQAKMDDSWVQRRKKASQFGHNTANIPVSFPHKQNSVLQSKNEGMPSIQKQERQITTYTSNKDQWQKNMQIIDSPDVSNYVHVSRSTTTDPQTIPKEKKSKNSNATIVDNGKKMQQVETADNEKSFDRALYSTDNNVHITLEGRYMQVMHTLAKTMIDNREGIKNGPPVADFANLNFGSAGETNQQTVSQFAFQDKQRQISNYGIQQWIERAADDTEDLLKDVSENEKEQANELIEVVNEVKNSTLNFTNQLIGSIPALKKMEADDKLVHYSGKPWATKIGEQIQKEKEDNRQNNSEASQLQQKEKASQLGHNITNIPINSPHQQDSVLQSKSAIQTKLTIGEPGDKYEREADSIAEVVMNRIYSPQFQQQGQAVQRIEALEEEQELQTKPKITSVQRMEAGTGEEVSTGSGLESDINSAKGGGQRLDADFQQSAEQAMGINFSRLRIHADSRSAQLAGSIGARAFAFGQDVFFNKGEYNPKSRDGMKLALHEMAHYGQQNPETVQRSPLPNQKKSQPKTIVESNGLANNRLQRKVKYDGNKGLVKSKRLEFSSELQNAMELKKGQHRCHTISYEIITDNVKDPINESLNNKRDISLRALDGLVKAVFPNGSKSGVYPESKSLQDIASKNYNEANNAINNIANYINNIENNSSAPTMVVESANKLIGALNNSPDNLRPGAGNTNSSIHGALDLTLKGENNTLPSGTPIVDAQGNQTRTIREPLTVLRVEPLHEKQVKTLLTETYSKDNKLEVYSSGEKLQSSDIPGMNVDTMKTDNPTPLAIDWGEGKYFLFDI